MSLRLTVLCSLWLAMAAASALGQPPGGTPWATDLSAAGPGVWRSRAAIDVLNAGPAVTAEPVAVAIGAGPGELALAGARAQDIRVTDDSGIELLHSVLGPNGEVTSGPIAAGAQLIVPATAPQGGNQRLWVYWNHPAAILPPERLALPGRLANPSFEEGTDSPSGWIFSQQDSQHRVSWDKVQGHTGSRSLRVEVDRDAAATWVNAHQERLGVRPGGRYRVTGWVKALAATGRVGYYVHVATSGDPMAINHVEAVDGGTFEWQPITWEFTAPPEAHSLSLGSVLYGTGQAWFDDVSVTPLEEPTQMVRAEAELPEALAVTSVGAGAWPTTGPLARAAWRVTTLVINLGPAADQTLVSVPIRSLSTRIPASSQLVVVDPRSGLAIPSLNAGDSMLFLLDQPANSQLSVPIYGLPAGATSPVKPLARVDLVDGPGNLAPNPGFEQGTGDQPTGWAGGTEGPQAEGVSVTRVAEGERGWAGRVVVPATAERRWVGWRQAVPAEPNLDYFFSARVKSQALSASSPLYVHLLNAERAWDDQAGGATGQSAQGDSDWTTLSGTVRTTPTTRYFEMHLTMNATGTIWYDDVVLRRVLRGQPGSLEAKPAPDRTAQLTVWTEDPIVKVFRDNLPKAVQPLKLYASRGERETLQVCVSAPADGKATVTARCGTLPLRLERVGYVPVYEPGGYFRATAKPGERPLPKGTSRTDGWSGWWPDYLVPVEAGAPVELTADQVQPVWVTVEVPRDTPPGTLDGQVTVSLAGSGVSRTVPFTLTVWPFTQPERPSLQVIYDLRSGGSGEEWLRFAAEHRISADNLPSPRFELRDGQVVMDTAAFDREATLRFDTLKMSAGYLPADFYACGWAFPPRDFMGAEYTSPEYRQRYQQALRLLWDHCKERGWAQHLSLYVSDEPHFERPEVTAWLGDVIKMIREVDPAIPVYSSTWRHNKAWDGILNHWGVAHYGDFPAAEIAERRAAGDKFWFTTDGQMELDTPYCSTERLLPWICAAHDVSGYEFWGLNWYTYNPFEYGWHSFIPQSDEPGAEHGYFIRYPNADGYLAYPGERIGRPGPISSIRLEQARDGIEDYELWAALKRTLAAQPDTAARIQPLLDKLARFLPIPGPMGYRSGDLLTDPSLPAALRQEAGDLLTALGVQS